VSLGSIGDQFLQIDEWAAREENDNGPIRVSRRYVVDQPANNYYYARLWEGNDKHVPTNPSSGASSSSPLGPNASSSPTLSPSTATRGGGRDEESSTVSPNIFVSWNEVEELERAYVGMGWC
jgi:hypothetical protein